ncbi:restriction endonuclease subunit S [Buttiauxella sp. WJP83]|uniref:restriction endonuclease subunit S n=1 Tax=Buttiauxella sp. WJP83 TaxID=2986951 RepID=UPI0022DD8B66|nr:restriction endonuclease subunit S [Buttiauxella sp. WJP83]WBM69026.1 restriction endonuclease subunit S [Buttiauxella sp. WJP83]
MARDLGSLPEGWVETTIGDLCIINPKDKLADDLDVGFMPMAGLYTDYFGECNFSYKKWSEVKKGFTQFQNGDVIFAKITPCFENGKAGIIAGFPNGFGAGSTEYIVLRVSDEFVNTRLLFSFIKTKPFLIDGETNMSGSVGHKRVPKEFVSNYLFPLPPQEEQKILAKKLGLLLAKVDSIKKPLDQIPQILKRFRQAVLSAAVSGKLTEKWRIENECASWKNEYLSQLCLSISDGDHQAPPKASEGVAFLVISDVNSGSINLSNATRWVPKSYFDSLKSIRKPNKNDLLYTVTGSFGIPVIVKNEEAFCFQRHIAIIKPNHDIVNVMYLYYFLKSPKAFLQAQRSATGTAQKTVALTSLRNFVISTPSLSEQTEIVARVEKLFAWADNIEKQVNAAQQRVNNLTQSILAKAFRGELTEQWRKEHPDLISGENSAAALLEKIKAERAAVTKKSKKSSK